MSTWLARSNVCTLILLVLIAAGWLPGLDNFSPRQAVQFRQRAELGHLSGNLLQLGLGRGAIRFYVQFVADEWDFYLLCQ